MVTVTGILLGLYLGIGVVNYINVKEFSKSSTEDQALKRFAHYIICNWLAYTITAARLTRLLDEEGMTEEEADKEVIKLFPTMFKEKHEVAATLLAEYLVDPMRFFEEEGE